MFAAAVIAAFIAQCGARNIMQAPMADTPMAAVPMADTPMTMFASAPAPAPAVLCNSTMDCLSLTDLGEFVFCNPDVGQCNACGDIGDVCCPFEDLTTGEMLVDCRDGGICIDGMCENAEQAGAPAPAPVMYEAPQPAAAILTPVYGAVSTGGYGGFNQ